MSRPIRALIGASLCSLVLTAGCARGSAPSAEEPVQSAQIVARGIGNGRHLSLESEPSTAAAALLPSGARYRVVIASPEQIALVVVTPDQRILGRMRIRSVEGPLTSLGSSIIVDDFGGPSATIDAWSSPGALRGEAVVGTHKASWQVQLAADGTLAARSWSARQTTRSAELLELRRAHAIGSDLARLTAELSRRGLLEVDTRRDLGELISLAELSLDLSLRAWEGRGRAKLPKLGWP
jgi:hypothetical protein